MRAGIRQMRVFHVRATGKFADAVAAILALFGENASPAEMA